METIIEKINVKKLREDIKVLVEEQKFLKDQRKTIYNKLERKIDPWRATMDHTYNRTELSIMYAALLVLRGKSIEEAAKAHISKKGGEWAFNQNKDKIQRVIDTYKEKEKISNLD
jgi:hypothetical protein